MIYRKSEIDEVIEELKADNKNELSIRAADMMDDMKYALSVWEKFSGFLYSHHFFKFDTAEEAAEFWNRPQDKKNTRLWKG